ncbi:unnamed protein product [Microthlaspi erraticum]|uniref:Uncharacterized protein n=1 Tax=Microthlaspi erraticum TaxID=1685480 RepID=A0A6D2KBK2_9BRAS|nr:unnamed protein product [Microthlaspi erraticum]
MGCLKKTVDESCPKKPDSTETPLLLEDSPNLKTLEEVNEGKKKINQITESPQNREKGKKHDGEEQQRSPLSLISNTGFRICRPVASFSWPKLPALADTAGDTAPGNNAEFASLPSHGPSSTAHSYPVKLLAAKRPLVLPFPFTINSPQIREIRDDGLASLKREFERLAFKEGRGGEEEELIVMTTPNSCVSSQNDKLKTPAKEMHPHLMKKKCKIEDYGEDKGEAKNSKLAAREKILSSHDKTEWSVVVSPRRYVRVGADEESILAITDFNVDHNYRLTTRCGMMMGELQIVRCTSVDTRRVHSRLSQHHHPAASSPGCFHFLVRAIQPGPFRLFSYPACWLQIQTPATATTTTGEGKYLD